MKNPAGILAAVLALTALAACGSGDVVGGRDWSRVYTESFGRVWTAALASLDSAGFYVDGEDKTTGRIRAQSEANRSWEEVALDIRIVEREESVRVDVQATPGAAHSTGTGVERLTRTVTAFLDELDSTLD